MLTAAEWNERYPIGTPVRYDGQVWTTKGRARIALSGVDWVSLRSAYPALPGRDALLSDVKPLATDAERLAAGWLDPAGAESLWDEREEARARLNEVYNDRLAQLRRFAAQQPVIDAAREWGKVMRLAEEVYGPAILRFQHSRALADAVAALDAAEAEPC